MKLFTNHVLLIPFLLISIKGTSQVTDTDVVNALLGKNYHEAHPILNGLGEWYHFHLKESKAA